MNEDAASPLPLPWANRIRPYPTGKPVEEVERELGHTAIKLASNENPLGPSPKALEAIRRSLDRVHLYPDSEGYSLRQTIAAYHDVDPERIIIGAGSTELIELAAKAFLSVTDEGITSASSFLIYRLAIQETGAAVAEPPLRSGAVDLAAIRAAVTPRTKIIFLANPNNPTGTCFTADEFDRFFAALPRRVLVVLDEAYSDYAPAGYSRALLDVRRSANILVLRTFSKIHGLAGLRVGYGLGPPALIAALNRVRSPFNTSRPAQAAAMAALEDREHARRSAELNAREMRFVTGELGLLGVRFTPSAANFVLIHTARDCEEDFLRLLHEGVIVRPMKVYGFPTSLRVTIGIHSDNERFLEALRCVMK